MGYYTDFTVTDCSIPESEFRSMVEDVIGEDPFEHGMDKRWYSHERDVSKVMLAYEVERVEIRGEGEGRATEVDVWYKVFEICREYPKPCVRITTYKCELIKPEVGEVKLVAP